MSWNERYKWIILVLLLIIALFLTWKCGKSVPASPTKIDTLIQQKIDSSNYYHLKADSTYKVADSLRSANETLTLSLHQLERLLNADEKRIYLFSTALDSARQNKDTIAFKNNCDSLQVVAVGQQQTINSYKDSVSQFINLSNKYFFYSDSAIHAYRLSLSTLREANSLLQEKVDEISKPKIFGGASIMGSNANIFGIGPAAGMIDKRGRLWMAAGQYLFAPKKWAGEATIFLPLNFKRKK